MLSGCPRNPEGFPLAAQNDSSRQVQAYVLREAIAKRVFDTIAPKFADRKGGYSRIIKLGNRKGDGADLAIIELLGSELEVKKAERAEKSKDKAAKKPKEEKKEE